MCCDEFIAHGCDIILAQLCCENGGLESLTSFGVLPSGGKVGPGEILFARLDMAKKLQQIDEFNAAKAKEALKNKTDNPFQSVILYDLGVSDLSSKEKTRLELMADMIKNGPSDRVYKLEGHADKQTGTAEVNKRIAAARAKKAYDFLVSKGVNPDQLTYDSFGDTANPYNGAKANRVVVIK